MSDSTTSFDARRFAESLIADKKRCGKLLGYAFARYRIRPLDAEDLIQESIYRLLRYQDYVRNPEAFFFTVFRNLCARFKRAGAEVSGRGSDERWKATDVFALMEELDARVAVNEGLSAISQRCRRLLEVYYLHGMSLREVARFANLADSSAAKTLDRCLRRLQECFE